MISLSSAPELAAVINVQKAESYIRAPGDEAYRMYQHYVNDPDRSFYEGVVGDVSARCLSIAQVITALIAIPLLFLAMLFVPAITSFTEGRNVGHLYSTTIGGLLGGTLYQIPESVLGVIRPLTLVERDTGPDLSEEAMQNGQQLFQQVMAQMQQNMYNG